MTTEPPRLTREARRMIHQLAKDHLEPVHVYHHDGVFRVLWDSEIDEFEEQNAGALLIYSVCA